MWKFFDLIRLLIAQSSAVARSLRKASLPSGESTGPPNITLLANLLSVQLLCPGN